VLILYPVSEGIQFKENSPEEGSMRNIRAQKARGGVE
jgi:hypothetical protein